MTSAPRPTVTLKIATSLDGRIATASGESKWITGEAAREEVHRLRAAHDAVLVGSQTVIDDDPELTVRLPGYEGPQPLRVVADARLRTPPGAKLLAPRTERDGVLVVTRREKDEATFQGRVREFSEKGREAFWAKLRAGESPWPGASRNADIRVTVAACSPALDGIGLDAKELLEVVGRDEGKPASVLLEGGGKLAASFMRAGLIDRIEWFRAPIILGGDGRSALAALELAKLADAPRFKRLDVRPVGDDLWERYERLP